MATRVSGPRPRSFAGAGSLSLALTLGCSLQDFGALEQGLGGLGGAGSNLPEAGAAGSDGGSSGSAGQGGTGNEGGTAGDGPDGGGMPVDPGNLLNDPGFEQGLGDWVIFGTPALSRVTTDPHTGGHCLRTTSRDAEWNGPSVLIHPKLDQTRSYRVSVWVRLEEEPEADAGLIVINLAMKTRCEGQTDETAVYGPLTSSVASTSWTFLEGIIPPETCTLVERRIYVEGPAPAVSYCIDDVSLTNYP